MIDPKIHKELRIKARRKLMDLIALRDHSEKELRTKLKQTLSPRKRYGKSAQYSGPDTAENSESERESLQSVIKTTIDEAIIFAKENNWLGAPEELSVKMAYGLHKRQKGSYYINGWLRQKGLPPISVDRDFELEKARGLIKNKFPNIEKATREEKAKISRFLASRGFDLDTVRKVIHEEF
jgi:regulatory protein